jgi:uncharacterized protein YdhG (YjbR/CyaY superfamily)
VQEILRKVRQTFREAAPEAQETIKYGMPTYTLNGNLAYFAGFKKHISFYPRTPAMDVYREELAPYESGKGTLKFPLDKPVPCDLIGRLVKVRVAEHTGGA